MDRREELDLIERLGPWIVTVRIPIYVAGLALALLAGLYCGYIFVSLCSYVDAYHIAGDSTSFYAFVLSAIAMGKFAGIVVTVFITMLLTPTIPVTYLIHGTKWLFSPTWPTADKLVNRYVVRKRRREESRPKPADLDSVLADFHRLPDTLLDTPQVSKQAGKYDSAYIRVECTTLGSTEPQYVNRPKAPEDRTYRR